MTSPFSGYGQMPGLPTPPTGWPIGSYATYAEAQRAVDHLADNQFPVAEVNIRVPRGIAKSFMEEQLAKRAAAFARGTGARIQPGQGVGQRAQWARRAQRITPSA